MRQISPDHELDITSEMCPMTYVRTRLALDRMRPGEILCVRLRGADPETNVPRSAEQHGHVVLGSERAADGSMVLYLKRG